MVRLWPNLSHNLLCLELIHKTIITLVAIIVIDFSKQYCKSFTCIAPVHVYIAPKQLATKYLLWDLD